MLGMWRKREETLNNKKIILIPKKKLQYSVLSKKKNGLIYRVMIYNFNLISLLLLWIIYIQVISFLSPSFPFLSPPSFSLPSFLSFSLPSFISSSGSCDDGKRNGIYKFYLYWSTLVDRGRIFWVLDVPYHFLFSSLLITVRYGIHLGETLTS